MWLDTVREGVSRMDVWLVSDEGAEERPVEELQVLLNVRTGSCGSTSPNVTSRPPRP